MLSTLYTTRRSADCPIYLPVVYMTDRVRYYVRHYLYHFLLQFYKDQAAPAPMVPDECVLKWGRLHKLLMEECGGNQAQHYLTDDQTRSICPNTLMRISQTSP